ncbi:hydroxypyruvate isomerase [Paenochrobactrum gallinarii]|uniref:Hydroxypyruvate isomerase n=1 Tax=Paenochrobactrum gallinarii TaxID=643673 RepID=A0A841M938_9HYPH|nr:TIM barrel protein [Paenochrobactrum gallinarii]MBB6262638.1 hydroxypyruvate isomerase [Paenochrobactrum gallinarii]
MIQFSANLGFLWSDLTLPAAVHAAHRAGFAAVECHWPYNVQAQELRTALQATGLSMLGLNTLRGKKGESGLTALPGRQQEARAAIDQAIQYAVQIDCKSVHVMAGISAGDAAEQTYFANLDYACYIAKPYGITILIEPLNNYDAPGYFLTTADQAAKIIRAIAHDNLKMMFDCYHLQITQGNITRALQKHLPLIGHIQIAAIPDRGPPDHGELNYQHLYQTLTDLGWDRPLGAEYLPNGPTEASLRWLHKASVDEI